MAKAVLKLKPGEKRWSVVLKNPGPGECGRGGFLSKADAAVWAQDNGHEVQVSEGRMLLPGEIARYARRKNVRPKAVENFLLSADNTMPLELHLENLKADAKRYGWNTPTVQAIRSGLFAAYEASR